ncbi:MAG TPA: hypothetical protein VD813_16075, partial [Pseudonocardia sp.]|nr:hypothetical protein [Pseudonocardia sp.]
PIAHRRDARWHGGEPGRWAGLVALAATLAVALVTAGCGAGQYAQTAQQTTNSTGAAARVGEIAVLDVEFLFDRPVFGDEVYGVGSTAPLAVTIVNTGDRADRLVRVSSPIAEGGVVVADDIVVPGGQTLTAGQVGPVAGIEVPPADEAPLIALTGLRVPIRSGVSYPVVFGFERAGDVRIEVPVDTPASPRRDLVELG